MCSDTSKDKKPVFSNIFDSEEIGKVYDDSIVEQETQTREGETKENPQDTEENKDSIS